ncbi:MAG: hypothetical protein M1825_002393 [Sarcosagium campestre]|nr:MAG: hypothetical protein M1825_002393 [Sarcosagium campestre]
MATPRVFIIRHGETEWSLNGRHTGTTELPLTEHGERRIRATGKAMIGDDRLIDYVTRFVSPRKRAQRTLELLQLGCQDKMPWQEERSSEEAVRTLAKTEILEDIREWDYGDYEGLKTAEIRERRLAATGSTRWDIWKDGCPGGESPDQVSERLDKVIANIRSRFQKDAIGKPEESCPPADVLLVAHGHILRAFAMRWIGKPLRDGPSMLLEAGGVGTLSYEHHNIEEPAILLGGSFMVGDE